MKLSRRYGRGHSFLSASCPAPKGFHSAVRSALRVLPYLLAIFALVLGLAACGGGGGGSTSSTPSTATRIESSTTAPKSTKPPAAAKPARHRRAARLPRPLPASTAPAAVVAASHGGGAPAFRRRGGDNSVPDFGAEAPAVERNAAAAALASYLRAYARGEWGRACAYLSTKLRRSIEQYSVAPTHGRGCSTALGALGAALLRRRSDPLTGGLVAFRVQGDHGFALFHGPDHKKYDMPMQRERGAWKVTEATPFQYPY